MKFFKEGLKPLIKAQMEKKRQELDTWKKVIKKTVEVNANAAL